MSMRRVMTAVAAVLLVGVVSACGTRLPADGVAACAGNLGSEQELSLSVVAQREKEGQLYAALAALETLPESAPEVLRYKGDVRRRLGRDDAADYFRRLQKTCLAPWGDHGLGLIAAEAGDLSQARELLGRAVRRMPTEYRFRNDLGVVLLHLQQMEEARFELMTALELSPDPQLPAVNLLALFIAQEKPAAARSLAQRYRLGSAAWQAAAQSCEELRDRWQRQGLPLPGNAACQIPAQPLAAQGDASQVGADRL